MLIKKANNNYKKNDRNKISTRFHPVRNLILFFFTIILTLLFFLFFVISCTFQSSTEDTVKQADKQTTEKSVESPDVITSEELEEAVAALEEQIDYDNAVIGAQLKGFIPSYLCTNKDNYIKIEVTNTSDFAWKCEGGDLVRVGYHYYGQNVEYTDYDRTARTALPCDIAPGESAEVEILINDITNEGIYVIQIDIVLEGKFWFSSKGVSMIDGVVLFKPCTE
jgi:hypothetical protein